MPVGDVAMVARAVDGLVASTVVDRVVVVAPPAGVEQMRAALARREVVIVEGGADRVASVSAGLRAVGDDVEVVLVHDAARCLCPPQVVQAVVTAVRAATAPSCRHARGRHAQARRRRPRGGDRRPGRSRGRADPQGFAAPVLRDVHARAEAAARAGGAVPVTDDAGLVEHAGGRVTVVAGDPRAFKITTPLDLAMAEALVAAGTA